MIGLQPRHLLVDAELLAVAFHGGDRGLQDRLLDFVDAFGALAGQLEVRPVEGQGLQRQIHVHLADLLAEPRDLAGSSH